MFVSRTLSAAQSWPSRAAVCVAATLALWMAAPAAQATPVLRNANTTLNAQDFDRFALDVDLNGVTDFTFTATFAPGPFGFDTVDVPSGSRNAFVIDNPPSNGFPTASRLLLGDTVSSASQFSSFGDKGNLFFRSHLSPTPVISAAKAAIWACAS